MSEPSGHDELVANFVGITNAPASEAEHMLEAAGWDLDTAVQIHFDGNVAAAATTSVAAPARIPDELPDLDEFMDEARGSRAAAALAAAAPIVGEDGVRVADSVKRERLFDTRHARQPRVNMSYAGPDVQQLPFGDMDPDAAKRTGPGLDSIYQPPTEILSSLQLSEYALIQLSCSLCHFSDFDETAVLPSIANAELTISGTHKAKECPCRIRGEAEKDDKWILFNLQARLSPFLSDIFLSSQYFAQRMLHSRWWYCSSAHDRQPSLQDNTIFASLQLNADLWRNNLIQDIVKGSFIFCQRTLPVLSLIHISEPTRPY